MQPGSWKMLKTGKDCNIIIVQYDGDAVAQVTLVLVQGGVVRGETIAGTDKKLYLFKNIINQGADVYGLSKAASWCRWRSMYVSC